MKNMRCRKGLILLVVLGMLALFSLLAVTYVVFASQTRATSVAHTRRYVRETPTRPLMEEAIKQLIRGTTDTNSSLYGHDLLGDLYGANETARLPLSISVRTVRMDSNGTPIGPMVLNPSNDQRPLLIGGGRFLRIPIDPSVLLPIDPSGLLGLVDKEFLPSGPSGITNPAFIDDILNGRVVTFPEGEGPLGGNSFRIVRYIGNGNNESSLASSSFSITIDLHECDMAQLYSHWHQNQSETRTIADWATLPVNNTIGAYLCYRDAATGNPADGYRMILNAVALNGHGAGVFANAASRPIELEDPETTSMDSNINVIPAGLQPNAAALQRLGFGNLAGDTDEPIDAADYNTMFMSYRGSTAANSADIIPSFHRAALINYLAHFKSNNPQFWTNFTEYEFFALIRRIELATLRPLSMEIQTVNPMPDFMGGVFRNPYWVYVVNPQFGTPQLPTLKMNIPQMWDGAQIPIYGNFEAWFQALLGNVAWDVDNVGKGIPDSIWMDIGLPLQRTPDGKLLKALVAYYVDDLDGKIDINAAGGTAQASSSPSGGVPTLYAQQSPLGIFSLVDPSILSISTRSDNLLAPMSQGMGYGPAEISFRHLYGKPNVIANLSSSGKHPDNAYADFMLERYRSVQSVDFWKPGRQDWGAPSQLLHMREYPHWLLNNNFALAAHRNRRLPGLPVGIRGRVSVLVDRLGEPYLHNHNDLINITNNEYESRLIAGSHEDTPFSIAQWEKIYRVADSDWAVLPDRLQSAFYESDVTLPTSSLPREISPRSRHLIVPKLALRSRKQEQSSTGSFFELVNALRRLKYYNPSSPNQVEPNVGNLTQQQFQDLFPLEFRRGSAMNLNRPFGNGLDDNDFSTALAPPSFDGNAGEIDEPSELASIAQIALAAGSPNSVVGSGVSVYLESLQGSSNFDPCIEQGVEPLPDPFSSYGPFGTSGLESRQLFARHLYCLAQLVVPFDYAFPNIENEYWRDLARKSNSGLPGERTDALRRMVQIRSRILAQWAVNVVDFRDADSVMTRFPYDPDPLNVLGGGDLQGIGWRPERKINPAYFPSEMSLQVVWGLEQPELLLTESLAFHDLRVRLHPTERQQLDQFRKPEGSLFLELYAPRSTGNGEDVNRTGVSPGLYSSDNNNGPVALDLSRLTPAGSGNERFPVWRVYISYPRTSSEETPDDRLRNSVAPTAYGNRTRFDLTHQLAISNVASTSTGDMQVESDTITRLSGLRLDLSEYATDEPNDPLQEPDSSASRIIWFTHQITPMESNCPGVVDPTSQVFVNRTSTNANPLRLTGNQYLVVGPRQLTHFGSRTDSKPGVVNHPSQHRIALNGNWAQQYQADGTLMRQSGNNVRDVVTIEASVPVHESWGNVVDPPTLSRIGLNVSEPLTSASNSSYEYDRPTHLANSTNDSDDPITGASGFADLPADAYWDYSLPNAPSKLPFDDGQSGPLENWAPEDGQPTVRIGDVTVVQPGTQQNWCTAYLQRLADPNKPWHGVHNPYISVDWIPIDLTVFSGEEDASELNVPIQLASRQKSGQLLVKSASGILFDPNSVGQSVLTSLTDLPTDSSQLPTATNFLKYQLEGDDANPNKRPSQVNGTGSFATLGFLNSTFALAGDNATLPPLFPSHLGAAGDPMKADRSWHPSSLFWANRPFVNSMELAYVPVSSPGQLGQEFSSVFDSGNSRYMASFSNGPPSMPTSPGAPGANSVANDKARSPFTHLLNFFQESPELRASNYFQNSATGVRHGKDMSLAWMFDLTTTLSPWADVDAVQAPRQFIGSGIEPDPATAQATDAVLQPWRAPYNTLSAGVEPGRINLNSISEPNVFKGLLAMTLAAQQRGIASPGDPSFDGLWSSFEQSRRGYGDDSDPAVSLNPNFPTQFAGLYKPVSEGGMVPATRNNTLDRHAATNPVQSTLLRSRIDQVDAEGVFTLSTTPILRDLVSPNAKHPHVLTDLYPISRLQNLVTERSNVFAVYVTVGLFDYSEVNGIGREYGLDTGQNKRFKAFYVIDRSIPVGYRVGEDLNTEKTILVRRILSE